MKCPACNTVALVMSERQGVEIDYCPDCRGVWLDRGELDKIIERSAADAAPQAPLPMQQNYARPPQGHPQQRGPSYGHKRRKHWLEDIFD